MRHINGLEEPSLFAATMPAEAPLLTPVAHFALDPDYAGAWIVAADLDGDGQAELVSARNVDANDVHYTSAAVACRLDGTVLWRWGGPGLGRSRLHHDVACQIHDWDGDGAAEVILAADQALVTLDGATGEERGRFPIPAQASDCVTFADLTGKGRPTEVLVKSRYHQIWAYTREGELLWTIADPGGYPTAHQPYPIDLDGDGRDEIMAGHALLNPDGTVRWVLRPEPPTGWHLDCARSLDPAHPVGQDLILSLCGPTGDLVRVTSEGEMVWRRGGVHYESVDIARFAPGAEPEIVVDFSTAGPQMLLVISADGELLGRFDTAYCRSHRLVDWHGDGHQQIVMGQDRMLCDGRGRPLARFEAALPPEVEARLRSDGAFEYLIDTGNLYGRGGDVLLHTNPHSEVWVFSNPERGGEGEPGPLGFGLNYTLY